MAANMLELGHQTNFVAYASFVMVKSFFTIVHAIIITNKGDQMEDDKFDEAMRAHGQDIVEEREKCLED